MIFAFGRRALIDALTERWLRIDHAGGAGEIPKAVDRIRTETIGPLRVFVLCDSDRLFSGHETKTKSDIEEYCQPKNVKYAILAKRAMENYLPVSALQQVPNHRQSTYRAFLNLTQIQRDFYDMKRGFQKNHDGHAEIPPEQRDLFQHLPPTILDALCGGFGRNVWEYYKSARRDVTKAAIRLTCPDDPGEIERILDEIESLL